ncbi:MAG: hypothetical protein IPN71_12815 [Fibrobacteres bacterium]|nr:hypothetical protein [Fibrobacterota bacterium]
MEPRITNENLPRSWLILMSPVTMRLRFELGKDGDGLLFQNKGRKQGDGKFPDDRERNCPVDFRQNPIK